MVISSDLFPTEVVWSDAAFGTSEIILAVCVPVVFLLVLVLFLVCLWNQKKRLRRYPADVEGNPENMEPLVGSMLKDLMDSATSGSGSGKLSHYLQGFGGSCGLFIEMSWSGWRCIETLLTCKARSRQSLAKAFIQRSPFQHLLPSYVEINNYRI